MRRNKRLLPLLMWAMGYVLSGCNGAGSGLQNRDAAGNNRIDLFADASLEGRQEKSSTVLTPEAAVSQSTLVAVSGKVALIDSSLNRSATGHFYVYRAVIDSVLKGKLPRHTRQLCFITPNRMGEGFSVANCCLYLQELKGHEWVKKTYPVQWQWVLHAPVLPL